MHDSCRPTAPQKLLSFCLIALILYVGKTYAETNEPETVNQELWEASNATLLKETPRFFCLPRLSEASEIEDYLCNSAGTLPKHMHLRLVGYRKNEGQLRLKVQYEIDNTIYTEWIEPQGAGSIMVDPDQEQILPELPPWPQHREHLVGTWALEHWELEKSHPAVKGQLIIRPGPFPNTYLGNFIVDVNYRRNQQGKLRSFETGRDQRQATIDQPVTLTAHGETLIVESHFKKARPDRWGADHMRLKLSEETLLGNAGTPWGTTEEFDELPEIMFRRLDISASAQE